MYYALIILSVCMFGGTFVFNREYQKRRGNDPRASFTFSLVSALVGLPVLLIINGFNLEFTVFTLLMATLSALNGIAFTSCSLSAMGYINLSLFSLFSMLGGMALPFAAGILFFGEKLTVAKAICFILICLALGITVKMDGHSKGGVKYYIGVFVFNGLSGVISKTFEALPFEKTSAAGFSVLSAAVTVLLSAVALAMVMKRYPAEKMTAPALAFCGGHGALNRVANFILVLALAHVDASVQYPMVTGGVIIVSTAVCFFSGTKPSKRELIAVAVSFIGLLALLLPI